MPGTTTTGSTNIALLDSKTVADLCAGKFYVDASPSIYIGSGASSVLGANVKIVNPYNVTVKEYGTNYEIAPALSGGMNAVISFNIPTQASNYQYGKYTISVQLYDAGGASWVVTKTVSVCEPDKNNKTRNYGTLSATLKASCTGGSVDVITDTPPNYNGKQYESQVLTLALEYPTSSGLAVLNTAIGSFRVQLYEGVYKLTGTDCVTYNFTDNVFVKVNYKIKLEKNIRCLIDECCVFTKLAELNIQLKAGCTLAEQERITSITVDALLLLKTIQLAADCGEDASDYITDLEKLLGCTCTCNCAEGTPIINTSPAKNFSITGCGFTKTTVGLTDTYALDNYEYVVGVVNNGGVLVIGAATLNGCVKTQQITFSIDAAYAQIKNLANANDTEAGVWASVVNKVLTAISGNCVISGWSAKTFKERIEAIVVKLCACCDCAATIDSYNTVRDGANVVLSWTDTGDYIIDIYLDGVLKGSVLSTVDSFVLIGAADGIAHTFLLMPRCSNNKFGSPAGDVFTYLSCPSISPPVVSSNNVNGVTCPYDLTTLTSAPPAGITYEWHTANNTNASSLVPNATQVSSGVYYVFAKDSNGCYSTATTVTLTCAVATSCTAPQNLLVTSSVGGFLVQFQSAAFPPPANSYTVKRRVKSDPDVDGSYTTIGTPVWNAGTSRWEILDTTAVGNVLYTYKAISNCGGSPGTTPFVTYDFANISCPTVSYTPATTSIAYSFTGVGGGVDKYEVKIYDSTGTTLIHTDTHTPAFPTPIVGTFTYLNQGTIYKIRVRVFIGAYYRDCSFTIIVTDGGGGGGSNPLSVAHGTNQSAACGAPVTVYVDSGYTDILTGIFVYTDSGLTTLLTGKTHIRNLAGEIFNINSVTGQVGVTTGVFC